MLALVDIDGTLLHGPPVAHLEALARALAEVYGVPAAVEDIVGTRPGGRTDMEIARLALRGHGLGDAEITAGMRPWVRRAVDLYPALDRAHPPPAVAPGAAAALERLRGAGVATALLTGNLEPIAHAKIARAGLAAWLPRGQGAFGSDHEHRDRLVPIALGRAGGAPPRDVAVVGDTPRDIACARAAGARCVAVATGSHGPGDLRAADAVVSTLEQAADALLAWAADAAEPTAPGPPAPGRRPAPRSRCGG